MLKLFIESFLGTNSKLGTSIGKPTPIGFLNTRSWVGPVIVCLSFLINCSSTQQTKDDSQLCQALRSGLPHDASGSRLRLQYVNQTAEDLKLISLDFKIGDRKIYECKAENLSKESLITIIDAPLKAGEYKVEIAAHYQLQNAQVFTYLNEMSLRFTNARTIQVAKNITTTARVVSVDSGEQSHDFKNRIGLCYDIHAKIEKQNVVSTETVYGKTQELSCFQDFADDNKQYGDLETFIEHKRIHGVTAGNGLDYSILKLQGFSPEASVCPGVTEHFIHPAGIRVHLSRSMTEVESIEVLFGEKTIKKSSPSTNETGNKSAQAPTSKMSQLVSQKGVIMAYAKLEQIRKFICERDLTPEQIASLTQETIVDGKIKEVKVDRLIVRDKQLMFTFNDDSLIKIESFAPNLFKAYVGGMKPLNIERPSK